MSRRPSYGPRTARSGIKGRLLLALIVLTAIVFGFRGAFRVGPAPDVKIEPATKAIGVRTPVTVTVTEPQRGLSHVAIALVQNGKATTLVDKRYVPAPAWRFGGVRTATETYKLEVGRDLQKDLRQGEATIKVTADRAPSWLRHPDPAVESLKLPVRLTPPTLAPMSTFVFVRQGGSEAVVYRVGPTSVKDGVSAGRWFFPGYDLPGGSKGERFAFFAVPYDMDDASGVKLVAEDEVGNKAQVSFIDKFFPVPLHRDTIHLNDAFLNRVVPAIMAQNPDIKNKGSVLDNYVEINREVRKTDRRKLVDLAKESKPEFFWSKPFLPMGSTKVMAHFADRRTYLYEGRKVDQEDHLGLDMAGVAHAPIPAANDGIVVLARFFDIYGNAVVIDHGYGLMSLYGHMSALNVKEGDHVTRGQIIGRSGETGLAGGDHLHFAMVLDGLPVTPIEWWDPHWIQDRIARKLGAALPYHE